jgi:hypothetical protein
MANLPKPAPKATAGQAIYQALTGPAPAHEPPRLPDLRSRIAHAWKTWQTSPHRYSKIAAQLPALITDTDLAVRYASSDDRRTAHGYSADLHGLIRTVTKRIGRVDLSLLAADRAIRAAENADDPLRLAAAHWNLTQVLLADNQPEGAETVALHGIEQLQREVERGDVDALALRARFSSSLPSRPLAKVTPGQHTNAFAKPNPSPPAPANATPTGPSSVPPTWTCIASPSPSKPAKPPKASGSPNRSTTIARPQSNDESRSFSTRPRVINSAATSPARSSYSRQRRVRRQRTWPTDRAPMPRSSPLSGLSTFRCNC